MFSYWLRWIVTVIWALCGKAISIEEKSSRRAWVLFDQLDLNFHMNNAQFYQSLENARIDFVIRCGLFSKLNSLNITSMLGGSTFQFRRQLNLFQVYDTTAEIEFLDEKWIYFKQEMWCEGNFVGRGIARIGLVSKKTGKLVNPLEILIQLYKKVPEKWTKPNVLVDTFISHDNLLKQ